MVKMVEEVAVAVVAAAEEAAVAVPAAAAAAAEATRVVYDEAFDSKILWT